MGPRRARRRATADRPRRPCRGSAISPPTTVNSLAHFFLFSPASTLASPCTPASTLATSCFHIGIPMHPHNPPCTPHTQVIHTLTHTQVSHNLGRVLTNRTLGIVRSEIQQARPPPHLHPLSCTHTHSPEHLSVQTVQRFAAPPKRLAPLVLCLLLPPLKLPDTHAQPSPLRPATTSSPGSRSVGCSCHHLPITRELSLRV